MHHTADPFEIHRPRLTAERDALAADPELIGLTAQLVASDRTVVPAILVRSRKIVRSIREGCSR
jgi:hypothetical protein